MTVARAVCPGCRRKVELDPQIEQGEWVNCPHCNADLEVISLRPLVLDWADDELAFSGKAWAWTPKARWANEQSDRKVRLKQSHP